MGIGIIVNGRYAEIGESEVKKHNLKPGKLVSAGRVPIVTEEMAATILNDPYGAEWPQDCVWYPRTGSLIHLKYYYRMNPSEVLCLRRRKLKELGLEELFKQEMYKVEN